MVCRPCCCSGILRKDWAHPSARSFIDTARVVIVCLRYMLRAVQAAAVTDDTLWSGLCYRRLASAKHSGHIDTCSGVGRTTKRGMHPNVSQRAASRLSYHTRAINTLQGCTAMVAATAATPHAAQRRLWTSFASKCERGDEGTSPSCDCRRTTHKLERQLALSSCAYEHWNWIWGGASALRGAVVAACQPL